MKKKNYQQLSTNNCQPTTVIVANGKFPNHKIPLSALTHADIVVCCDGATAKVDSFGITPTAVVGDLDSLDSTLREKYSDRLFHEPDQNSNDLTKAVMWCLSRNYNDITIIGATGLREDHTLGNIGLLSKYAKLGVNTMMLTDTGYFVPILESSTLNSYKGQQVSIFSPNNKTLITTSNLKYPITNSSLEDYWMGTLNESLGDSFGINFEKGPLVVFMTY